MTTVIDGHVYIYIYGYGISYQLHVDDVQKTWIFPTSVNHNWIDGEIHKVPNHIVGYIPWIPDELDTSNPTTLDTIL